MSNLVVQGFLALVLGYLSTGSLTGAVILTMIYFYIANRIE